MYQWRLKSSFSELLLWWSDQYIESWANKLVLYRDTVTKSIIWMTLVQNPVVRSTLIVSMIDDSPATF
jgi:hypothetical protein